MDTLGPAHPRHHLPRDDCQPPVRLDPLHRSNQRQISLGQGGHPGRLHHLHRHRNLDLARRRLPGRSVRAEAPRLGERCDGRRGLDHQRIRRFTDAFLCRRGHRRRRRFADLRRHRRQRREMVPGQAGPRHGTHRRRFRRRLRPDRCAPCQPHPGQRLSSSLSVVWPRPGYRHHRCCAHVARAASLRSCRPHCASGRAKPPRLHACRSAPIPTVLAHVRDVRHGRNRRSHGHGATRATRQRLRHRHGAGIDPRLYPAGPGFRAGPRPRAQRPIPAVLRLRLRLRWPREHDAGRVSPGGRRHLRPLLVRSRSAHVRAALWPRLLRLGPHLCSVSGDLHRPLRQRSSRPRITACSTQQRVQPRSLCPLATS